MFSLFYLLLLFCADLPLTCIYLFICIYITFIKDALFLIEHIKYIFFFVFFYVHKQIEPFGCIKNCSHDSFVKVDIY